MIALDVAFIIVGPLLVGFALGFWAGREWEIIGSAAWKKKNGIMP
jgi:hypothetical protein